MKRILVTGGAGYVGSHTAKALSRNGFDPIVLDDLSAGHRWAVQWGPLAIGDIADYGLVRRLIDTYNVQALIHFAAHAYVWESMDEPAKYFENNVTKTLALLRAALDGGVNKVVFSSTCATYGVPASLPISDDHIQYPSNPYGDSKLFIEKALRWYGEAYGLQSVSLRYFNAAGADPEGEIGEVHDPETHLIPLAIEAALQLRDSVGIYGTDYETPDGTAIRDYVHVADLAKAHVKALQYLLRGGQSMACNLGTGRGHSVREVISAVGEVAGTHVKAVQRARRPGDPPVLVAKVTKARTVLGWSPEHTDLRAIIGTAWSWHSSAVPLIAATAV